MDDGGRGRGRAGNGNQNRRGAGRQNRRRAEGEIAGGMIGQRRQIRQPPKNQNRNPQVNSHDVNPKPDNNPQDSKNKNRQWDGPVFGFKRIHGFLTTNEDEVIGALDRNVNEWENLLQSTFSDDFLVLIIYVLGEKVCSVDCNIPMRQVSVLSKSCGSVYITKLKEKCFKICTGIKPLEVARHQSSAAVEVDQSSQRILNSIYLFCLTVAQKMPKSAVESLMELVVIAKQAASSADLLSTDKNTFLQNFESLWHLYKDLREQIQTSEVQVERRRRFGLTEREENELHDADAPDDFREIPITPTIKEIMSTEETFLRTNKRTGSYKDANHYLDVQFRLLREDFVQPLKTGIKDFTKNRHDYLIKGKRMPLGNIRIYQNVKLISAELVKDIFVYNIQLAENNYKKVKWEKVKRLLNGSLLVFTSDFFSTAYFATVAVRDTKQLQKGILGITWEGETQPDFSRSEQFLVAECEAFFEASRHTLQVLKTLNLQAFPMYKFIVESSSDVGPPEFLRRAEQQLKLQTVDLDNYFLQPLMDNQWPGADMLGLDDKQYDAFKAALTREFAIIQGPPGTGKTFLGLKIAEVLLNNTNLWKNKMSGPILVVCYTNHALDQFLEGIVQISERKNRTAAVIRVGGRTQSEVLDSYSLTNQRRKLGRILPKTYYHDKSEANHKVQLLQNDRAALMTELLGLNDLSGIVDYKKLQVWEQLHAEFPAAMWACLDRWHEEVNRSFTGQISEDAMINMWFKVKVSNEKPDVVQPKPLMEINMEDVSSDDEDYDVEELMADRVVDDIYSGADSSARKMGRHLSYLSFSVVSIENLKSRLAEEHSELDKKEKNEMVKRQSWARIAQETAFLNKKQTFVRTLFYLYNKGLLETKDAKPIITIWKTRPTYNMPALTIADKWGLFFTVVTKAKHFTEQMIRDVQKDLIDAQKKLHEILRMGDGVLLQSVQVVGMTTTGAAKYNDLLKIMRSPIVIVEEAAEVLEAHIVTCITRHCQHLILIGDHQQLRPSTNVYKLAKKYNLELSLFERMLNNNLNCYQLQTQHRMRPEIANLIMGTIYAKLDNHNKVSLYPSVTGITKNLYFINHKEKEKADTDSTSKSNIYEAKFLAKLCRHIILQGYTTDRVTVLTTYVGQMFLLKKEIGNFDVCKGVRVTCVDNFQGEENDIILLSLVRSNESQNIGFLKEDNRICVAVSRAKHGLYICGNMSMLVSKSETWRQIQKKLLERDEIGEKIDFECQIHGNITSVGSISDFDNVNEGGCQLLCDTTLKCKHKCLSRCHVLDKEHTEYKCRYPCEKKCNNDHQCTGLCFQKCKPCSIQMTKTLSCGHTKKLACHVSVSSIQCMEHVEKTLLCGHKEIMACHRETHDIVCKIVVQKTLRCGHQKELQCHIDINDVNCKEIVAKRLGCGHDQDAQCYLDKEVIKCRNVVQFIFQDCQHKIDIKCFEKNQERSCRSKCTTRLECGHACTKICHVLDDPDHVTYQCKKDCGRLCAKGEHKFKVSHKCHMPCRPCVEKVLRVLPCLHMQTLECHLDPKKYECLAKCERKVPDCKHPCQKLCHQDCFPCNILVDKVAIDCGHIQTVLCSGTARKSRCKTLVPPRLPSSCVHNTLVPCSISETITPEKAVEYCEFPCGVLFAEEMGGCGHRCKGTCSSCQQGRLHLKCQQECQRPLVCGHLCTFPCSQTCPPCEQPCNMKCEHSECRRVCGEPCADCNEKCTWGCPHRKCSKLCREMCDVGPCYEPCPKIIPKCSHPCVGFCGDPCPPLCRICDEDELTEVFIGYEDEDGARFVYLEDCKHTIESQGMDTWIDSNDNEGEIGAKRCPRCKTLIRLTRRYGNYIRNQLQTITKVKEKIFGDQEAVRKKLDECVAKIYWDAEKTWESYLPSLRHYLLEKLIIVVPSSAGMSQAQVKRKKVGESSMESFSMIARHGEDTLKVLCKSKTEKMNDLLFEDLRNRYNALIGQLRKRIIPLGNTEARDFDLEFQRIFDLHQLYLLRSSPRFTSGNSKALPIYEKAVRTALSLGVYSKKIKDGVYKSLQELENVLKTGLGISERERIEILSAFNMRQGRWFKCPNGHVYVITECGGAMVESTCNECGAKIGGGQHQLRADNALASEMDGATRPLWPNMV